MTNDKEMRKDKTRFKLRLDLNPERESDRDDPWKGKGRISFLSEKGLKRKTSPERNQNSYIFKNLNLSFCL
ncbi:hypothetical protein DLM78_16475 [Leptospira stimsonii]|uniref:Uncharacterized protein n=1 Tax=Leptospira stimsonii TaxID=2202203 RepID=A0A8B3CPZ7_9LEPT|nr:hypothetical protein DLM78_16475 [Leptospira stimsonii]